MKITKSQLKQIIKEELEEAWTKDISSDAFHHRQGKGGPPDALDKVVDDSRARARAGDASTPLERLRHALGELEDQGTATAITNILRELGLDV